MPVVAEAGFYYGVKVQLADFHQLEGVVSSRPF
jgi:hypothetical protein